MAIVLGLTGHLGRSRRLMEGKSFRGGFSLGKASITKGALKVVNLKGVKGRMTEGTTLKLSVEIVSCIPRPRKGRVPRCMRVMS